MENLCSCIAVQTSLKHVPQESLMSQVKNKSYLAAVMRHDFSGKDVLVSICKTPERADELVGEYTQLFLDKGFTEDEVYFYATLTIFYDQ